MDEGGADVLLALKLKRIVVLRAFNPISNHLFLYFYILLATSFLVSLFLFYFDWRFTTLMFLYNLIFFPITPLTIN